MADLSAPHRAALQRLVFEATDVRTGQKLGWASKATAVSSYWIKGALKPWLYTTRQTRDLMQRLRQAGLVEPALRTCADAVTHWRITDAGVAALAPEGTAHG